MNQTNPLMAQVKDDRHWFTGIGPVEGLDTLISGIDNGSWLEIGLGTFGTVAEAVSAWWDPIGAMMRWAASWVMEHLERAKRFLDQLAGNPPVIEAYAATWSNVATAMAKTADDIEAAVAKDLASWHGDAADAYRGQIAEKVTAMREAGELCAGSGRWTSVIGTVVGAVRAVVREMIAALVAWLGKSIGLIVLTGPFGVSEAVRTAVSEIARVTSMIADVIQKLLRSLGNLKGKLPDVLGAFDQVVGKLAPKGTRAVADQGPLAGARPAGLIDPPRLPGRPGEVRPAGLVDEAAKAADPPRLPGGPGEVRPAGLVDDAARVVDAPRLPGGPGAEVRPAGLVDDAGRATVPPRVPGGPTTPQSAADQLLNRPLGARPPTVRPAGARTQGAGGAGDPVRVIHAGSVSTSTARRIIKTSYPLLPNVNPKAWENVGRTGLGKANCVQAAFATDSLLATGRVTEASVPGDVERLGRLLNLFGRRYNEMVLKPSWDAVTDYLRENLGPGGRAVIAITRAEGPGHVINVHWDQSLNRIVYLDGWVGKLAVHEEFVGELQILVVAR